MKFRSQRRSKARRERSAGLGTRVCRRLRALALSGAFLAMGACSQEDRPVRIVLITCDTLRYDGFDEATMPNTLAFAREGAIFDRFYAATASTQPTHATIFTGLEPWKHGVTRNAMVLEEHHRSFVEILKLHGFQTEAVVASFPLHSKFGFARGFDRFDDEFTFEGWKKAKDWMGFEMDSHLFSSACEHVTQRALEALDRMEGNRQFLWLHYFDPHDPYGDFDKPKLRTHHLRKLARNGADELEAKVAEAKERYASDVRRLDRSLGILIDRLQADRKNFATHVLFTVDHGESFGEDGLFGHGNHLTPEQIHVPTFLVSPRVSPGRRSDPAGSSDIHPTILSLAGISEPSPAGRNLGVPGDVARMVFGMRKILERATHQRFADGREITIEGSRFFAVYEGTIYSGDGASLWRDDLWEHELTREMANELSFLFRGFEAELETSAIEAQDPETEAALRALGYAE